jgi:hypothetical protein
MKKFLSFEHTFTKGEIESIIWAHICKTLDQHDKDFKEARLVDADYTYSFTDKNPEISVVVMCDEIKMKKP